MDFGYSYYTTPEMKIKVEHAKVSFGDGHTKIYVSVSPESISIRGDWPDGTNLEKMKKKQLKYIMIQIPNKLHMIFVLKTI